MTTVTLDATKAPEWVQRTLMRPLAIGGVFGVVRSIATDEATVTLELDEQPFQNGLMWVLPDEWRSA